MAEISTEQIRSSGSSTYPDGYHLLAQLISTDGLMTPIKASARIKYTCIAVSRNYIALGASSGSLYVFHRNTLKYLQAFANSEGGLTKVVFAPDDNIVGIATSQGFVVVLELNIERRLSSERLAISSAHRNGQVTAMIWDDSSQRLFTGDDHGRITFLNAYHRKVSGLFKLPTELVMDADSTIVQLDFCDDKLLASTLTKCFICDTKKKQAYAVGTKPRDGQYGACFLKKPTKDFPVIYSARPGSRIWEVNIVGQVQTTHQLKRLLAVPSLPILGFGRTPRFPDKDAVQKPQSLSFQQLLTFGHGCNLLLTWTSNAVYVFDPANIGVTVWSGDFKDILWACVYKSRVYCLHSNNEVSCYTLLSAERCISKLFALSLWEQCAQTAVHFAERIQKGNARRYVPQTLIREVNYQLMDGNADYTLIGQLEDILGKMEDDGLSTPGSSRRSSLDSCEGVRLESGIYLVRNRTCSEDSTDDLPLLVDRETQMDDETLKFDRNSDHKKEQDADADSGSRVETTSSGVSDHHDVALETGVRVEDEVDCVVDSPTGPAGISWDFGQGRLTRSRQDSILGEIAQALVKEGELDTSIAESLNDTPLTTTEEVKDQDLQTDHQEGIQNPESTFGQTENDHHGNQEDSTNQNTAFQSSIPEARPCEDDLNESTQRFLNSHDDVLLTDATSEASTSIRRNSNRSCDTLQQTDQLEMGPVPERGRTDSQSNQEDSQMGRCPQSGSEKELVPEQQPFESQSTQGDSQMGTCPGEESLPTPQSGPDMGLVPEHQPSTSHSPEEDSQMGTCSAEESLPTLQSGTDMRQITERRQSDSHQSSHRDSQMDPCPPSVSDKEPVSEQQLSESQSFQGNSQMGTCPAEESLPNPQSGTDMGPVQEQQPSDSQLTQVDSQTDTSPGDDERNPRPAYLPFNSLPLDMKIHHAAEGQMTIFQEPVIESVEIQEEDFSPVRRPLTSFKDENKERKQSAAKEKRRSRKSRIIDLDAPAVKPTRGPATSTPTKRSASLSSLPPAVVSPVSSPTSRTEPFPTSREPGYSRSVSLTQEGWAGSREYESNEENFWAASPMMFALTGPKVAAQLLAPSFTAMKVSLSSKLVKTKTFLKQMSDPEAGVAQVELPVSTATETSHRPFIASQTSHPKSTPGLDEVSTMHRPHRQLCEPARLTFQVPSAAVTMLPFDEGKALAEYCHELPRDDGIGRKLAAATWKAKHKLKDPSLALSVKGASEVLERWLQELQSALATKSHPPRKQSHSVEVMDHKPRNSQDGELTEKEDVVETLATPAQVLICADVSHQESTKEEAEKNQRREVLGSEDSPSDSDELIQGRNCEGNTDHIEEDSSSKVSSLEIGKEGIEEEVVNHLKTFTESMTESSDDCLHRNYSRSSVNLTDPFGLPTPILDDAAELAMLCFELGVFGNENIAKTISVSQSDRLSDNDGESSSPETDQSSPSIVDPNMNTIQKGLESPLTVNDPQDRIESVATCQAEEFKCTTGRHDAFDSSIPQSQISEADSAKKTTNFVKSLFFLLDVERLRKILESREDCRHLTMAAILECVELSEEGSLCETKDTRLIDVVKKNSLKGKPLNLIHIQRLLACGEWNACGELMVASFPSLPAWEVMYLTQSHQIPSSCFLEYAMALLDTMDILDRDTMLNSICSDIEVRCHLLTSALSQDAPSSMELFCTCGRMPRPGAHMKEWRHSGLVEDILALPTTHKTRLLEVCCKHGYWHGVLKLCIDIKERGHAIKTALQLTDMELLSKKGILSRTTDEWLLVLHSMSILQPDSTAFHCVECNARLLTKQGPHWSASTASPSEEVYDWSLGDSSSKPECDWAVGDPQDVNKGQSDWLPTVTWESISVLLVKCVGAGLAVKMLLTTRLPSAGLPQEFYRNCILTSILEKQERVKCLDMLEGLDTYLWSNRNKMIAPSYNHQIEEEFNLRNTHQESDIKIADEMAKRYEGPAQFTEDPDCQWGTHVVLNSDCEVCGIALSSPVSTQTSGLIAFPCGHSFHRVCVTEEACVLCYELNCYQSVIGSHRVAATM
ncbi:uncharacterized protein LOC117305115 isoform X2 [Asterias rubens]|uniref:uncharacterized protein LOC117305115 isoform X2 n=1 Tax=Asterias rubens TaxID=7604 RepID=UPI0014556AF5|nr:uncharacterized protein LOC117305115 isoform X2 [Asterias rubens]